MKYKVMRGFCLGGGVDLLPGQITELSERSAELYLRQGRVEPVAAETVTGPELMAKAALLATIALSETVGALNELVPPGETDKETIAAYQMRVLELEEEEHINGY